DDRDARVGKGLAQTRFDQRDIAEFRLAGADALNAGGADGQDGQRPRPKRGTATRQPVVLMKPAGRNGAGRRHVESPDRRGARDRGTGPEREDGQQGDEGAGGSHQFSSPVAGSVSVSPELLDPSEPRGSVAGRGGLPS